MIELSFNTATRVINFYKNGRWFYDLGPENFLNSKTSLETIQRLSEKSWITPEIISQMCAFVAEGNNARCA